MTSTTKSLYAYPPDSDGKELAVAGPAKSDRDMNVHGREQLGRKACPCSRCRPADRPGSPARPAGAASVWRRRGRRCWPVSAQDRVPSGLAPSCCWVGDWGRGTSLIREVKDAVPALLFGQDDGAL